MTERSPFRHSKTRPEIIRLAVMLDIRFPRSLRKIGDLYHERAMLQFRRLRTLQTFASAHASVHTHFPTERHLQNRNICKQTRAAALGPSGPTFWLPDPNLGLG